MIAKPSKWEMGIGVNFLKKVGIQADYKILDFGCNEGNYTIPASIITKHNGIVYAVDENDRVFNVIKNKANLLKLNNLRIINTNGKLKLNFDYNIFDFVMLFDVLHYLKFSQRKKLYQEISRILKNDAILSVYPKHTIGDFALMELRNVTREELINEIESNGFEFYREICDELSHDGNLENGCVVNFKIKM